VVLGVFSKFVLVCDKSSKKLIITGKLLDHFVCETVVIYTICESLSLI